MSTHIRSPQGNGKALVGVRSAAIYSMARVGIAGHACPLVICLRNSNAFEITDPLPVGDTLVLERLEFLPPEVDQGLVHRAAQRRRRERAAREQAEPVA